MNAIKHLKANYEDATNQVQQKFNDTTDTFQRSGNDWLSYINSHPVQSILFGVSLFYSIKGFFKSAS